MRKRIKQKIKAASRLWKESRKKVSQALGVQKDIFISVSEFQWCRELLGHAGLRISTLLSLTVADFFSGQMLGEDVTIALIPAEGKVKWCCRFRRQFGASSDSWMRELPAAFIVSLKGV